MTRSIVAELASALREFIYETTHLSPQEDDGSHICCISAATLNAGRHALAAVPASLGVAGVPRPTVEELVHARAFFEAYPDPIGPEWKAARVLIAELDAVTAELAAARETINRMAGEHGWRPMETAPRDGTQVMLWLCPTGSIRRGFPDICWWATHPDWGDCWARQGGKEIAGEGVATHWRPLPEGPE